MSKIVKSKDELIKDLLIQLKFLSASAKSFDKGNHEEAIRIAIALRILLRETSRQRPLLEQLGIRKKLYYLSTSLGYDPNNMASQQHLLENKTTIKGANVRNEYIPKFDKFFGVPQKKWCSFESWWNEVVLVDGKRNTFTRQKIVLYLADQDGGAHVDPEPDEKYYNLKNKNSMNTFYTGFDGREKPPDTRPALMTVRQICYEFMYSISKSLNEIIQMCDLGGFYYLPDITVLDARTKKTEEFYISDMHFAPSS